MKLNLLLSVICTGLLFCSSYSVLSQKNIHQKWDSLLQEYVSTTGKVDYQNWKKDLQGIASYIEILQENTPTEKWSKDAQLAYWINAYNAVTVQLILDNYPIKSIQELDSPWDTKLFYTSGIGYTLNEIEHGILRKMNEPRIHFAINCASKSCPKLQKSAFWSSKLDEQLEKSTYEFLNDSSMNIINKQSIQLSKIFDWFGEDFGDKTQKIEFVSRYTKVDIDQQAKLTYIPYNWSLNQ